MLKVKFLSLCHQRSRREYLLQQTKSRIPESGSVAETQEAILGEATQEAAIKASKESKRTIAVFNEEDNLKLVEFFKDN